MPVTHAGPVMVGITAGLPATVVSAKNLPVKREPTEDSFTKSVSRPSSPRDQSSVTTRALRLVAAIHLVSRSPSSFC